MRPLAAAIACVLLAGAPAMAFAQVSSLALEDQTWTEVREAVRSGTTTVLVPIGGTEQSGPHIALGKHNARARALALRIAAGIGHTLVAPVIAYVPEGGIEPATGHMRFPGTISIPEDAFERTLEGAARSLRRHGFRDIVLLGDHGGYQRNLRRVAARLDKEWGRGGARVHVLDAYYVEMPHGGRDDTALTLAVAPGLVRAQQLPGPARDQGFHGDPRGADAAAGRAIADEIVDRSVQSLKKALGRR